MALFKSKKKLEAELRAEIAAGRYFRALQYYMENGRFAEAAEIAALKGEPEKAGQLFERAGQLDRAAAAYARAGDYGMAALLFRDAGKHEEAADAFAREGRHESAAEMYVQVGDMHKAAEQWRAAGDLSKAAAILEQTGDTREAARLQATQLERQGQHAEAAALWEAAGNPRRALDLYQAASAKDEAARLAEHLGEIPLAATLRLDIGDFLAAARHFEALGQLREAAYAFGRGGDLNASVGLLSQIGEWFTVARIYLSHRRYDEARSVLRQIRPEDPNFEVALSTLGPLEEQQGNPEDAYRVYEALVRRHIEAKTTGGHTRHYILRQVNILWSKGMFREAMGKLQQLNTLGIMTPELQERLDRVQHQMSMSASGSHSQLRAMSPMLVGPSSERYEFKRQIAQGGNGIIYLAYDRTLDRELVIKMIRETALPTEIAIDWFMREAKTSAKLNHPNIVTIYDLGSIDGQPYIAMEFVDGETLVDYVERTELPMRPGKILDVYLPLCKALQYAHGKGFVHRDIKLENVMLTRDGEVKLMDFGLAQAMRTSEEEGMITGTPLYMPPEQIVGADIDHRADVYSMGIMLFLLAAGQWPYERGNVLHHHRFTPIPDPRQHNPDLPEAFVAVVQRALAKDREARYGSVAELGEALVACFG